MAIGPQCTVLLLLWSISLSTCQYVRMPPGLVTGPPALINYKDTARVSLECVGVGSPTPTYEWKKNGQPLVNNGNIQYPNPGLGTIVIDPCGLADQGYYQCILTNSFGMTMSNMTFVQMGTLGTFPPNIPATNYSVDVNGYTCLTCRQLPSIPAAQIYWTYNYTGIQEKPIPVTETAKIQTNPFTGDLCLTHVQSYDAVGSSQDMYICNVENAVLETTVAGSYSRIFLTGITLASYAPLFTFGSKSTLIALEGDAITLRAFFSGSPIPEYIWRKNGQPPPQDRWAVTNSGTGLTLRSGRLTQEDAGEFTSQGSNGIGSAAIHTILLTVHARPMFLNNSFQPHDMNVTNGDIVTVKCDPYAIPNASVTWYKNGAIFTASSLPQKYTLSADSRTLTISGVCKACYEGNAGDHTNIQCNASNQYGYGFVQGYINVLERTTAISGNEDRAFIPYKIEVFDCQATSDPITPDLTRTWYISDVLVQESATVIFAPNGSLVLLLQNETDGGESRLGEYKCVVSNGFSQDEAIYNLGNTNVQSAGSLWWVGLIVGLLILFLLLLLLLFWFRCRNNGGTNGAALCSVATVTITSVGGTRFWVPYTNETFECQAISSDGTRIIHTWYYSDAVVQESETVILSVNGSLRLLMQNEADGGRSRLGQYKCIASNGSSEAEIVYILHDGNVMGILVDQNDWKDGNNPKKGLKDIFFQKYMRFFGGHNMDSISDPEVLPPAYGLETQESKDSISAVGGGYEYLADGSRTSHVYETVESLA